MPDQPRFLKDPPPGPPLPRGTAAAAKVPALAADPRGRLIAAALDDGRVVAWLPPLASVPFLGGDAHRAAARAVAFHPRGATGADGDYEVIASASVDFTIRTWHLGAPSRGEVLSDHDSSVLALGWSPDGVWLASGSEDRSVILRHQDGTARRHQAHDGSVLAIAFSPDGARYATGGADGLVRIWATDTGVCLAETGGDGMVWSVAWSPDGAVYYAASEGAGRWDPRDRSPSTRWGALDGRPAQSYAVACRPSDGAAVAGFDRALVRLGPGAERGVRPAAHAATIQALAFLPDGRLASGGDDGVVHLWGAGLWPFAEPAQTLRLR
jgi:WD40 repeat protein